MRTFHTGGVFTGNIAQQIRTPIDGQVVYSHNSVHFFSPIRTRYGEDALITTHDIKILIVGVISHELKLPINTILLVKDQEYVRSRQLIAEVSISKQKGQASEIASKYVISDLSGEIYFDNLILQEKKTDSNYGNRFSRAGQFGGLIWILSGYVSDLSIDSSLGLQSGDYLETGSIIHQDVIQVVTGGQIRVYDMVKDQYLQQKDRNHFGSKLNQNDLSKTHVNSQFHVINSISVFKDLNFFNFDVLDKKYLIFETELSLVSSLPVVSRFSICPKQFKQGKSFVKLGKLLTEAYFTNIGGVIRYSQIQVGKYDTNFQGYPVLEGGTLLLIPEESYQISLNEQPLFVSNNQYIQKNTLLFANTYSTNEGLVELEKN